MLRNLDAPRRLRLRSAHRRRRRHPDAGARTRSSRSECQALAHRRCPPPGEYGVGMVFLPRDVRRAQRVPGALREGRSARRGSSCSAGGTCRSIRASAGSAGAQRRCPRSARSSSARGTRHASDQDGARAQALRDPQARRARWCATSGLPRLGALLRRRACRRRTLVYKGLLLPEQIPAFYPDLRDPDVRQRARAGPPALQHQHLPVVGPRPPLPLHRAQRRDQHAARQR